MARGDRDADRGDSVKPVKPALDYRFANFGENSRLPFVGPGVIFERPGFTPRIGENDKTERIRVVFGYFVREFKRRVCGGRQWGMDFLREQQN